ncbi:MAG: hypothetical protein ACFB0F_16205 [Neomegalonema sp.]
MDKYKRQVFLNYPYDKEFFPILDAVIFSVICCGFIPRSCEEEISGTEPRIERILKLIASCQHGVHDLSASASHSQKNPRLNMPFELGIFYGAKRLGGETHRKKDAVVFDSDIYRLKSTLSDTAGLDFQPHNNEPLVAIVSIQRYLKKFADWDLIGPKALVSLYIDYQVQFPDLCDKFDFIQENIDYSERRSLAAFWLSRVCRESNLPK